MLLNQRLWSACGAALMLVLLAPLQSSCSSGEGGPADMAPAAGDMGPDLPSVEECEPLEREPCDEGEGCYLLYGRGLFGCLEGGVTEERNQICRSNNGCSPGQLCASRFGPDDLFGRECYPACDTVTGRQPDGSGCGDGATCRPLEAYGYEQVDQAIGICVFRAPS